MQQNPKCTSLPRKNLTWKILLYIVLSEIIHSDEDAFESTMFCEYRVKWLWSKISDHDTLVRISTVDIRKILAYFEKWLIWPKSEIG